VDRYTAAVSPSMPQETCWTLIRAAADGHRAEREEFSRRYEPAVRAFLAARWKHGPMQSEVDDGVQEVFVACFKEGGALAHVDGVTKGFRAFLWGVVRNVALHMERTRARRVARVSPGAEREGVTEDSGLSRVFDREYARALVREAVETMATRARIIGPEAQRRVELLERRHGDGLPLREIARVWEADGRELHLEQAKAAREFRSALRQVIGLAERCAPARVDLECERLLRLME